VKIVFLGLSVTSSWGNGHATTYRSLIRGLAARKHDVLFLERDKPWYAANRDLPDPPFGRTRLYTSLDDLKTRFRSEVRAADLVIVGSYVPEGVAVAHWALAAASGVTAFYDIDTPVTLAKLAAGDEEYLAASLIPLFDLYLSFTGGPTLRRLAREYGARGIRLLYCSVDPDLYYPERREPCWDLGYIGTYSKDRQPALDRLILGPARQWPEGRFVVAGPLYPESIVWPPNLSRVEHLPPGAHRKFYNSQRFTLNITRAGMIRAGYSPSVRLFEAAACGTPIISDYWPGLDEIFEPGREILAASSTADALRLVRETPESERRKIAQCARRRILDEHTCFQRAAQLEQYLLEAMDEAKNTARSLVNSPALPASH
jgi:spore maturation protein CgeB